MTITGLVDVVKANYLNFLGTIYAYSLNEEKTDMHPYVKAIQELIPTAVYVSKDPFYIQCIAKDGVLKIVLRQMEDGQLGIEFLKEKAEQKDAAAN